MITYCLGVYVVHVLQVHWKVNTNDLPEEAKKWAMIRAENTEDFKYTDTSFVNLHGGCIH